MQSPNIAPSTRRDTQLWDVASIGLLLIAAWYLHDTAGYHRYSYYESLRNWVTLAWVAAGIRFYVHRWYPVTVLAAVIAVLFNPLSPITMRKWQWQLYDHWTMILSLAAAVGLAILAYKHAVAQRASSP
jgi:hypothetical protein